MCDYSLHLVASRPAKVGDQLVTSSFPGSMTRGFAAVDQPMVAVCVMPGTELAFDSPARYRGFVSLFRKPRAVQTVARFRQINVDKPHVHHDALEFPNGKVVMVTNLVPGQRATVLQLPVAAGEHRLTTKKLADPVGN